MGKSLKSKIFWENFFEAIGGFIIVWLLLGYSLNHPEEGGLTNGGFLFSYVILSLICVFYWAIKIGLKFRNFENITEKTQALINREKISIQEFREKYKHIIEIYDESINLFDDIKEDKTK